MENVRAQKNFSLFSIEKPITPKEKRGKKETFSSHFSHKKREREREREKRESRRRSLFSFCGGGLKAHEKRTAKEKRERERGASYLKAPTIIPNGIFSLFWCASADRASSLSLSRAKGEVRRLGGKSRRARGNGETRYRRKEEHEACTRERERERERERISEQQARWCARA